MKKTLQKTLAVVMVIAMIFSQMAIMSFATEVYEEITLGSVETVTLTEENDSVTVKFTPAESGNYIVASDNGGDDNIDPVVNIYDSEWDEIADSDDDGGGRNFAGGFYAEAGVTYYIELSSYNDGVCEYNYKVYKNPLSSISAVLTRDLIENTNGYYTTDSLYDENDNYIGESDEYYKYEIYSHDFEYTIVFNGETYTGNEEYIYEITGAYPSFYANEQSYDNQWGVGVHECRIGLLGVEGTCEVEVVENPVASVSAKAYEPIYAYTNGGYTRDTYYDDYGNETGYSDLYYYYYIGDATFEYTVTLKDGSVLVGNCDEIFETLNVSPDYNSNQSYENQWKLGQENKAIVSVLGVEGVGLVEIVEVPLDYLIVNDITVIKNTDGYWETNGYWDSDLEEWVEESRYFYYSVTPSYTAVMKDGTRYESDVDGDIRYDGNWIHLETYTDQDENHWDIGEYEVNGTFLDREVSFTVEVVETPIKNITLTPERDLIFGIDEEYYYTEYVDFIAEIEFKDGSMDECLVSDLYKEYGYELMWGETDFVSDYVSAGSFSFMGYDGEFEVTFINNLYESISISGTNEIKISFNKPNGTSDVATMLDYDWRAGGGGEAFGYIITDVGTFPGGISYAFDETTEKEYLNKDITIYIGDMESNTLETNNWYWAFSTSKGLYRSIDVYKECVCGHYYGRKFTGIDITTSNYNITDLANISAMRISYEYETEYVYEEVVDGQYYFYVVFDADDVAEMIGRIFNITNIDVTKHAGYNSTKHTIAIPRDGWGDDSNSGYTLEYKNGKWYGTREYSTYYSDEPEYINIILNDEMLLEKISFGKEDEVVTLNGWVVENGKWAYYENGVKLTNTWKADSKGWCYLGEDGYMLTNALAKDSHGWCYVGSNGYIVYNQWVKYDSKWYFIDANGYTVSNQWKKDSTGWCYLGSDGAMLTNAWVKDSKGWCYVSSSGYIVYNQWVNDGGKWYFVDANGYRVSNQWRKDSTGWCYLGSDGAMLTNAWVKDSKGWCYVSSNGYIVYNQWVNDGGKWYFVDANGYRVSNQWRKDSIGWCYLGSDGAMLTNEWVKDSKGWCYVSSSGYIVYNQWVDDGGKRYFVDANGYMVTNKWLKDGDDWYYVGANGSCLTNQWMKDSVGWCFLDENGKMVTNAMVTDSHGVCFVGEDGYWQSNVIIDDGSGYLYFDETGYLATDVIVHDGYGYRYFDETGYMVTDTWLTIDGESVYVDSNGYLAIQ